MQSAADRICPPLLHPWCPLPRGGLRIEDSYTGSDCWMGPYMDGDAHGGLDINHPAGTPIWSPFALDKQRLFNSIEEGDSNNRWEGFRLWDDGWTWRIGEHHVSRVLAESGAGIDGGIRIADGAGVGVGAWEHSHFNFSVTPPGGASPIQLDPWILFWQMYTDREITRAQ